MVAHRLTTVKNADKGMLNATANLKGISTTHMRRIILILLVVSLTTIMLGILFDVSKILTLSLVMSGCLTGTLIGDAIKRNVPMTYGVKVGGLVLGILCILIMGIFIVDYLLDLSLLPVSMPKLVIGIS